MYLLMPDGISGNIKTPVAAFVKLQEICTRFPSSLFIYTVNKSKALSFDHCHSKRLQNKQSGIKSTLIDSNITIPLLATCAHRGRRYRGRCCWRCQSWRRPGPSAVNVSSTLQGGTTCSKPPGITRSSTSANALHRLQSCNLLKCQ